MKQITLILSMLALTACTDPRATERALDDLGFKEVKVEGYAWWGCGKDYTFQTKFTAKNPNGKTVTGVVCSGWLMGSAVKFD